MVYGVQERSVVDHGVYWEFMGDLSGVYERCVLVYGVYERFVVDYGVYWEFIRDLSGVYEWFVVVYWVYSGLLGVWDY